MKRILLVDDDANILESARDILEESGYSVVTAQRLSQARQQLSEAPVDLIIVDFNLPDGRGPEFLREVKSRSPQLKVILFTGESVASLGEAAQGFDAIFTKPLDPAVLLSQLAAI